MQTTQYPTHQHNAMALTQVTVAEAERQPCAGPRSHLQGDETERGRPNAVGETGDGAWLDRSEVRMAYVRHVCQTKAVQLLLGNA
jgi:hypothetical protein